MNIDVLLIKIMFFVLCTCFVQYRMLGSVQKIFRKQTKKIVTITISLIIASILASCILYIENLALVYVIIFISESILFFYFFHLTLLQCYMLSCFYVFHMIALKGIVVGCISLFLKKNSFIILLDPNLVILSEIIAMILLSIMFITYQRTINVKKVRNFLICKNQMILVLSCHLVLTLFLLFNSFSFYYNLDLVWISVAQVMVGVLLYAVYFMLLMYGMHVADLLLHKIRDQNQIEIIKQQLMLQSSQLKTEKVLNQFRHDYREQILSVEYFIENNQTQKALQELKKDYLQILSVLPSTKKYSNNLIINSLLIDKQAICNELEIKLDASIYIPLDLALLQTQCHEIIRVILQNAIDANEKVTPDKRYIHISSDVKKQWLHIKIENPYNEKIIFEGSRPVPKDTTYDTKGMGLVYVEEALRDAGGLINYDVDQDKMIFKVGMLIPIVTQ